MSAPDVIEVLTEAGIYELRTFSGTRYLIDSRLGGSPRYARIPAETAPHMRLDADWHPLQRLECGPIAWADGDFLDRDMIDEEDTAEWCIRVGSSHRLWTTDPQLLHAPLTDKYFVTSTPCVALTVHDEIPAWVPAP
ncbi:hypothetical protein [Demequina maris]|uniref:hypothetical protein n=1 Tax=Demequina maris TaxID=1638982 RepID=UPI0007816422|nr:hypothetical protein [Demequina maris]